MLANCDGCRLYIGVQDDGTVVGLDDPDGVSRHISNMVRDAIKPDVTMFLHYETIEVEDKEIVIVDIQFGTDRPYYLAKKGMRSEGVYVRQGTYSVPATDTVSTSTASRVIRKMVNNNLLKRYEKARNTNYTIIISFL